MMYARTYWFSPRLHVDLMSHVKEHTLTFDMRRDERLCVVEKLKEKTNEELGQMVREWLDHPDVEAYPEMFTEWESEEEVKS